MGVPSKGASSKEEYIHGGVPSKRDPSKVGELSKEVKPMGPSKRRPSKKIHPRGFLRAVIQENLSQGDSSREFHLSAPIRSGPWARAGYNPPTVQWTEEHVAWRPSCMALGPDTASK